MGLNFSKPVMITFPVANQTNGTTVAVSVRHGSDPVLSTSMLTNDPQATCTAGLPSTQASGFVVVNNTITLYTCAASTFVAAQGNVAINNPA